MKPRRVGWVHAVSQKLLLACTGHWQNKGTLAKKNWIYQVFESKYDNIVE